MKIKLTNQEQEIILCEKCGHAMVNIDADQLAPGDLKKIKKAGLRISNPETEDAICLKCDIDYPEESFGGAITSFFGSSESNDDDDSSLFSGGLFGGGSSFGGGFGGFGGGGFSGGGVSRGF